MSKECWYKFSNILEKKVKTCFSIVFGTHNFGFSNAFHVLQVFAFVAPKIIGGRNAPSPVGELGMVEMTQALDLIDVCYEQVGGNCRYILKVPFPCFDLVLILCFISSLNGFVVFPVNLQINY